jgi:hypothetical protein
MAVATIDMRVVGQQKSLQEGTGEVVSCRIIEALEIETSQKQKVKLVLVQYYFNTLDVPSWYSHWKRINELWIQELKRTREVEAQENGTFWMDLQTYVNNFRETIISHWKPDYDHYSFADTHETTGHCVAKLHVK